MEGGNDGTAPPPLPPEPAPPLPPLPPEDDHALAGGRPNVEAGAPPPASGDSTLHTAAGASSKHQRGTKRPAPESSEALRASTSGSARPQTSSEPQMAGSDPRVSHHHHHHAQHQHQRVAPQGSGAAPPLASPGAAGSTSAPAAGRGNAKDEPAKDAQGSRASSSSQPQSSTMRWGSRFVDEFERLEQVGEGTYGQVYKARDMRTNEIVALKKVRMDNEREGFPITAIREIKILKNLHHPNIVDLREVVISRPTSQTRDRGSIYLVFEYMEHDLTGLVDTPGVRFTEAQIKTYLKQLLSGLHYCHLNKILHRDIKGSNLLISNRGELKLTDFGLARPISENQGLTNRVITLWYRPPELLLGANKYTDAIDLWSVGCLLAELLMRRPLFPGRSEIDQLDLIFKQCGSPTEDGWPEAKDLPWYQMMTKSTPRYPRRLRQELRRLRIRESAIDLIESLLQLNPAKRISAADALNHSYLWEDPLPVPKEQMPSFQTSHHEWQTKRRREQRRAGASAAAGAQGAAASRPPGAGQDRRPQRPGPAPRTLPQQDGSGRGRPPPGHVRPNQPPARSAAFTDQLQKFREQRKRN